MVIFKNSRLNLYFVILSFVFILVRGCHQLSTNVRLLQRCNGAGKHFDGLIEVDLFVSCDF